MYTLYAAPGACSRVPLITLSEAGVKFDVALIRFMRGVHKQPDYLALNPKGKVPCLVTEDGRMRVPMFMAEGGEAIASVKAKAIEAMHPMAAVVEAQLDGKSWWYSEDWSIVDAYIYWVYFRITGGGFPIDAYPNWAAHAHRMDARH